MENIKKNDLWKYAVMGLVAFFLLLALVLYPLTGKAAAIAADGTNLQANERTIDVTGSADILVAPDEVEITVGIETRNASFEKAATENDENAKKVMVLTKQYEIDPKYVQSDYIRMYPSYIYDRSNETTRISYYNVQKRIVIKLKDIDQFEPLVSDLTNSTGAIMIQNIEFRSTELTKYRDEARKLAARAAKGKAQLLTSELGCGIGKICSIHEEQVNSYTWYGSWYGSPWSGSQPNSLASNVAVNYQEGPVFGQEGETVSIGQIKITARIRAVFELK